VGVLPLDPAIFRMPPHCERPGAQGPTGVKRRLSGRNRDGQNCG